MPEEDPLLSMSDEGPGDLDPWVAQIPFYKADVMAFGFLCNKVSDHTITEVLRPNLYQLYDYAIELLTGACNQEVTRIWSAARRMEDEEDRQEQYDEWMETLIQLASKRAMAKLAEATRDSERRC